MLNTALRDFAARVEALHDAAMLDDDHRSMFPVAEQHLLLALAALKTAQHHFTLAFVHQDSGR